MLCDPKYRQQMKDRGDDPQALGTIYGDLINAATSDIPPDMTVTMHLCRGNYKSTFMGTGGYDAMQEVLFDRIKVHGYFMEYDTARAGGFEPLMRCFFGSDNHFKIRTPTPAGDPNPFRGRGQKKRRFCCVFTRRVVDTLLFLTPAPDNGFGVPACS